MDEPTPTYTQILESVTRGLLAGRTREVDPYTAELIATREAGERRRALIAS